METRKIIVNRTDNWFTNIEIKIDPYYMAITILEKLSTNLQRGIKYNRFNISMKISNEANPAVLEIIDQSIEILVSRGLIRFEKMLEVNKTIYITELGEKALEEYREMLQDVDQ